MKHRYVYKLSLLIFSFMISNAFHFHCLASKAEAISEEELIVLPSTPPQLSLIINNNAAPPLVPEEGAWIIQHIHVISQSLKLVDVAILQEEQKIQPVSSTNAESAKIATTELDEPGDLRNGIFLLFESLKRPYRYHAHFYSFDQSLAQSDDKVFLVDHKFQGKNKLIKRILRTSPKIDIQLRDLLVTGSKPNKLIISCEETDYRILPSVQNLFGRLHAKFEDDPLGMISMILGGASRVASAVMTHGVSEITHGATQGISEVKKLGHDIKKL